MAGSSSESHQYLFLNSVTLINVHDTGSTLKKPSHCSPMIGPPVDWHLALFLDLVSSCPCPCLSLSPFGASSVLIGFTTKATWLRLQASRTNAGPILKYHSLRKCWRIKTPPQEKPKESQRQVLYQKRIDHSMQTSRSPRLTIRQPAKATALQPKSSRRRVYFVFSRTSDASFLPARPLERHIPPSTVRGLCSAIRPKRRPPLRSDAGVLTHSRV